MKFETLSISQWTAPTTLDGLIEQLQAVKQKIKDQLLAKDLDPEEYIIDSCLGVDWGYYEGEETGEITFSARKKK